MPRTILERLLWHFLNYSFFFLYIVFAVAGLCAAWIGWISCDMNLAEQALKATHPLLLLCAAFVGMLALCGVVNILERSVLWLWRWFRDQPSRP